MLRRVRTAAIAAVGCVVAGVGAASVLAGTRPLDVRAAAESDVRPPPQVAGSLPAPAAPRLVETSPSGDRVRLEEPLRLRFDQAVDAASLSVDVTPAVALERRVIDDRTVELFGSRWQAARRYRVAVAWGDTPLGSFGFRTRVPHPGAISPGEGRCIALSFDDGPKDRGQADELLDVLRAQRARAVFFPTGEWARARADWTERARREGHLVCNHTDTHADLTRARLSDAQIRTEVERGAGHGTCDLFRPPHGSWDERVQRITGALGYEPYLWDIDTRDWDDAPVLDVVNLVLGQARPDAVVLFHMHASGTQSALPRILKWLRRSGYVVSHDRADCGGGLGVVGARAWEQWPQAPVRSGRR
jgi:peptidoglycan-N-acetylglucosamine deacetylase